MFIRLLIVDVYQDIVNANTRGELSLKKINILTYTVVGAVLNLLEISSYLILIYHVRKKDQNANLTLILEKRVIDNRNRVNAVSLVGLFAGWLMEIWFIVLIVLLYLCFDSIWILQTSSVLKLFEFVLIPYVQVQTSAPIKRFIAQSKLENVKLMKLETADEIKKQ